jgi:CelD/BcsL family acetyltransferase involved in cellulose biosynthesis
LDDAPGLATIPRGIAAARDAPAAARRNPFARCEVFSDLAPARAAWDEIERLAVASPYQGFGFVEAWLGARGRTCGIEPFIVVARDETGRPSAVLPLGRSRRGPVWTAEFLGGADANFKMGLFRPGLAASRAAIEELLRWAARRATARVDLFWLVDQPHGWRGAVNPMTALPRAPSPSSGHKTNLNPDFGVWLKGRYSREAQRKLRKKTRRLAEMGPLSHVVARDETGARKILATFLRQKATRMRALGLMNVYADAHTARFFEVAATKNLGGGAPTIELHALLSGDRIVATLGGLAQADRFCGMFLSYDAEPAISRCSPGQLLVIETIRDLAARGFATFDLGVGEARYKDENCEADEPLFDAAVAVTAVGSLYVAAARLERRLKRWTKQTPWARALADRLRRRIFLVRHAGRRAANS